MSEIIKDGYKRRVWPTCVLWYISGPQKVHTYVVARFPFVPDYHLCTFAKADSRSVTPYPMQHFKTLAEALAVLRVLVASIKGEP
jgi:hypothetical protein